MIQEYAKGLPEAAFLHTLRKFEEVFIKTKKTYAMTAAYVFYLFTRYLS
ncbi:hypothetical protein C824_000421 [Schaedlerella arabinosiphila]|nr:hypothetical protein C824_000421 [Schaedlerella arabinosiphila]